MCYDGLAEYRIIPTETFKIMRKCAGCGCKQIFSSKNHFRVNANGNLLDVWLIYGCEKCGYTYNLPVYERIRKSKIPQQEYNQFLANDKEKIFEIGTSKAVFIRNKAEIAWDLAEYQLAPVVEKALDEIKNNILIQIHNPYHVPVRTDKAVADILRISRSEAKKLLANGNISASIE